ncbi:MAG: hypothetical protein IBX69_02325 [Anaerolineales bacterium]|nr:hypothetical protein [Anaerolineales bacterium]
MKPNLTRKVLILLSLEFVYAVLVIVPQPSASQFANNWQDRWRKLCFWIDIFLDLYCRRISYVKLNRDDFSTGERSDIKLRSNQLTSSGDYLFTVELNNLYNSLFVLEAARPHRPNSYLGSGF